MIQDYVRVKSKEEVIEYLKKGYTVMGGGTYLSHHQENRSGLIDIQNLDMNKIFIENKYLIIGAATKFSEIILHSQIPVTLKETIKQEMVQNIRNAATIGGLISVPNRFSNVLAWLICAEASVQFYPQQESMEQNIESFILTEHKNRFIDCINVPIYVNVNWKMISRTPDDFPFLSVFLNEHHNKKIITILGYSDKFITIKINNGEKAVETLENFYKNAHSQYDNKFISLNYFKKISIEILIELLGKGER